MRRPFVLALCTVVLCTSTTLPFTGAAATAAPADGSVRSVAHWEEEFLRQAPSYYAENVRLSRSADSWDYYDLAYALDAYTSMFEATGKRRYARRALTMVRNMVDRSRVSSSMGSSQYRDSYRGWVSQRSDVRGDEVPLFESYAWRYVTRLLRDVRASRWFVRDPAVRAEYRRFLSFSERNIFDKWYSRGANENIYRSRTHMAAHWAYIALDLSVLTKDSERRTRYLRVFRSINRDLPNSSSSLRGQLHPSPVAADAYFWDDEWESTDRPGQDVAHANGVISYLVESRSVGREWTAADLAKVTHTFSEVVWPTEGRGAEYVDGSGSGTGWFADGFVKLGRYDADVQRRLETHRSGRSPQFIAALAANARILRAG